ncbi:MAG TPA: PAAR-like domain-containing protein [Polyangiales bacterium]|nr:PAAR-like domain-containing protein [Polyangiales bacterium]
MSTITVNYPKTPVTKGSNGVASATLPNVCKMPPPPPPFAPTPLPNIGQSGKQPQGYSTTVKFDGQPVAIQGASFGSSGDIASKATGGGIVSNNAEGPTKFIGLGSFNVQIEGKNVQLLGDPMLNNCGPAGSPANSATMMGVMQQSGYKPIPTDAKVAGKHKCECCGFEAHSQAQAAGKYMTEDEWYDVKNNPANAALIARVRANPQCKHLLPAAGKKAAGCNKYFATTVREKNRIETDWGSNADAYRRFKGLPQGAPVAHRVPKAAGGCPFGQGNLAPTGARCAKLESQLSDMQERCVILIRTAR